MIQHKFKSLYADYSDQTLVKPSNWNDTHTGTIDTLFLSVYSCTGSTILQAGVSGSCIVLCSASGASGVSGTFITLPPASGCVVPGSGQNQVSGQMLTIKKTDYGLSVIVIQAQAGDLIEGQAQVLFLANPMQFIKLIPDGGVLYGGQGWWVIGQN
jgi:hypothetical protein